MKYRSKLKTRGLCSSMLCILLAFSYVGYSQTSNLKAIEEVKTTKSKKFIEKALIGNWEFAGFLNPDGSQVMNPQDDLDIKLAINTSRPDLSFFDNGKYEITNEEVGTKETGIWEYDRREKVLYFQYDKPKYLVPIDKLSPELLEQLKKGGGLKEFTDNSWIITEITDSRLLVLEHLPHDEFELRYLLLEYVKE